MLARIDLPQGTLDLLILKTVALGPQRSRRISQRIRQVSGELVQIQRGWYTRRPIDWNIAVRSI